MELSIFGAAKKTVTSSSSAKRLQAALVTLGKVVGSAKLKVVVDGAIGQKTADAVNWAFTKHIGSGQAAAEYRTGKLTVAYIKANADTLAGLIERETARRGTVAASPATAAKAAAVQSIATSPASPAASKAAAKQLQTALVNLGKATGSAKLKVVVDGAVGQKTTDAVNWAFTQHIGSGQAPAAYRTGSLTTAFVKTNAGALAAVIEKEIQRRGGVTAAAKAAAASPAAAGTGGTKASIKELQTAVNNLGRIAGSARPQIKADGAMGPKTTDAVNWAFTQHIGAGQAPAQYRTGKLTQAYISANSGTLAALVTAEVKRRGGTIQKTVTPVSKPTTVKTTAGKTVTATKVTTAKGTTYKVTDPKTGKEYYSADPTAAAPEAPDGLPEASEEQKEAAAEASAAAAASGRSMIVAPELMPDSGGGDFLSEYKWPIIGGIAVLGLGAALLMRRRGGSSSSFEPTQTQTPTRTRTTQRRRSA